MSLFWNGFTNGFAFGMLRSTPMFSCFTPCFSFNTFNIFTPFTPFRPFNIFTPCTPFNSFTPFIPSNIGSSDTFDYSSVNFDCFPNADTFVKNYYDSSAANNYSFMNNMNTSNFNFYDSNWSNSWNNSNCWNNSYSRSNDSTKEDKVTEKKNKTRTESNRYSDSDTSYFSYDAVDLKKKWDKKKPNLNLSQEFCNKVVQIAKRVECDPNDLMAVMDLETGGTFKPDKTNPKSGAVGLIQFHPTYVSSYGTTIPALKKMTREEQLVYVEKYLVKNKSERKISGKMDAATLYALVFTPAWVNKTEIARRGQKEYDQNRVLDVNKDGVITKAELGDSIRSRRA